MCPNSHPFQHPSPGLVTHENTDISIAALGLLGELTDPDVVLEAEKEAGQLIDALVREHCFTCHYFCSNFLHNPVPSHHHTQPRCSPTPCPHTHQVEKNGLELLVQNLQRLDHEGKAQGDGQGQGGEEDAKGIHATLQVGWAEMCMSTGRGNRSIGSTGLFVSFFSFFSRSTGGYNNTVPPTQTNQTPRPPNNIYTQQHLTTPHIPNPPSPPKNQTNTKTNTKQGARERGRRPAVPLRGGLREDVPAQVPAAAVQGQALRRGQGLCGGDAGHFVGGTFFMFMCMCSCVYICVCIDMCTNDLIHTHTHKKKQKKNRPTRRTSGGWGSWRGWTAWTRCCR